MAMALFFGFKMKIYRWNPVSRDIKIGSTIAAFNRGDLIL
jgi:hypothetical protein